MKKIIFLLIFWLFAIIQTSFLPALHYPWNNAHILFPATLFLAFVYDFRRGVLIAAFYGLILDYYSLHIFGINTLSLMITLVILQLLFELMFTNTSLYSLMVLGLIGNALFQGMFIIGQSLVAIFPTDGLSLPLGDMWQKNIIWQIFFTELMLIGAWLTVLLLTTKFKLFFLNQTTRQ